MSPKRISSRTPAQRFDGLILEQEAHGAGEAAVRTRRVSIPSTNGPRVGLPQPVEVPEKGGPCRLRLARQGTNSRPERKVPGFQDLDPARAGAQSLRSLSRVLPRTPGPPLRSGGSGLSAARCGTVPGPPSRGDPPPRQAPGAQQVRRLEPGGDPHTRLFQQGTGRPDPSGFRPGDAAFPQHTKRSAYSRSAPVPLHRTTAPGARAHAYQKPVELRAPQGQGRKRFRPKEATWAPTQGPRRPSAAPAAGELKVLRRWEARKAHVLQGRRGPFRPQPPREEPRCTSANPTTSSRSRLRSWESGSSKKWRR